MYGRGAFRWRRRQRWAIAKRGRRHDGGTVPDAETPSSKG
jgi:hypothetical protein